MVMRVNLRDYDNSWYDCGAGVFKRTLWYLVNGLIFDTWCFPFSSLKCVLLRWFGAQVGQGVVVKPRVNVKYPWKLEIGEYVWLGEGVWIDNVAQVILRSNVCISQGAMLLTGNHDYGDPGFGLRLGDIELEEGVWIGARAIVCPGARVAKGVVLTVNSVMTGPTEPDGIYKGNPAIRVRDRRAADTVGERKDHVRDRAPDR